MFRGAVSIWTGSTAFPRASENMSRHGCWVEASGYADHVRFWFLLAAMNSLFRPRGSR